MENNKYCQNIHLKNEVIIMAGRAPVLLDEKRRIEKVCFDFDNPGNVEIEVPVITCEKSNRKFFHPNDVEDVLEQLEEEYERVNNILKKEK